MFENKIYRKKGFTLVELMITMAIIAILIVLSMWLVTWQREKARDTVRVHDITSISKAMDLRLADGFTLKNDNAQNVIPENLPEALQNSNISWREWNFWDDAFASLSVLKELRKDPKTQQEYRLLVSSDNQYYYLETDLERPMQGKMKFFLTNFDSATQTLSTRDIKKQDNDTTNNSQDSSSNSSNSQNPPDPQSPPNNATPKNSNVPPESIVPAEPSTPVVPPEPTQPEHPTENNSQNPPSADENNKNTPTGENSVEPKEWENQNPENHENSENPENHKKESNNPWAENNSENNEEVVNHPPKFVGAEWDTTIFAEIQVFLTILTEDEDSDTVTISSPNLPEWLHIDGNNIVGQVTNPWQYQFNLIMTDARWASTDLFINPFTVNELPRSLGECGNYTAFGTPNYHRDAWLKFDNSGKLTPQGNLGIYVKNYQNYRSSEIRSLVIQKSHAGHYQTMDFWYGTCLFDNNEAAN